ncbi:HAMP domain-containing sensor histidine kinase [Pedobacter antarcticus]|uniref:histidine kinase n=2 Tax=Pedobacter antarcticus TaxID=34086 RepID=A0A081PJT4_9SPHI|nr:HAMP domain-containing sensor histidine kinase [Pedobacter antarcticus]KEQ30957.1 histidine kinase [Pedobacter antarcticus 4BY]SDM26112.1 Signal transduction histidine kinase [Pedobacter antarcticus]SFF22084.1 Signal transduction histidine kinase [Pedobacter antarcticus]
MPRPNFSMPDDHSLKGKSTYWLDLIGSPAVFSLESRIFHSISVGLILLLSIYVPYNLYAGLYIASVSAFGIGLFFFYQYYHSRFHGIPHNNTLFGLIGLVIFGFNYFANSGINGSTDLIWPAYLLLVFTISPYRQHLTWLVIYLLCFLALHIVEYYYPFLVRYPFSAGRGQFIDRVTAFPIPVVAIYIIIKFIRENYDKEKKAAEEKAVALEVSKAQLSSQKDQLEQSNVEKNKLMSIISHDLRTPLMNIQSYLELLNENELDNAERSMMEKALLTSTNNAVDMLSNLLHWSKSQMEGSHVNLVELNLLSALLGSLEMEKVHAWKKGISLNYQIPPQLNVIADKDMLQLVVRNLVSNAVKFTPAEGTITIHAESLSDECKITINDNGKGITPEQQENIFSIKSEPTFGTNNERGVGLGLVLCKEFTERQGGQIGFESHIGLGSSFFIILPLGTQGS